MEKSKKKGDIRKFFKVKKPTESDTQQKPEEGDDGEKTKLQKGHEESLKKASLHSHHERESEEGEQQPSSFQGTKKKIQIDEEAEESLRRKKIEISRGENDAMKKKGERRQEDEKENTKKKKKKEDGLKEEDVVQDRPSPQKNKGKTNEKTGKEKEDKESDEHQSEAILVHRKKRRLIRDRSSSSSDTDEGYENHTHHKSNTSKKQQVTSTKNEEETHAPSSSSSSSHSSLESKTKLKRGVLESFLTQKDSVGSHSSNSSKRGLDEEENSKEREKKKMVASASFSSMKKKTGGEVIMDVDAFFSAAVEKDVEKALSRETEKTKEERDAFSVEEDEDASEDEREKEKTKKDQKDREVFDVFNDEEERERKKDKKQDDKILQKSAKQWTAMLKSMKPSKLRGSSERVSDDDDDDDVEKQAKVAGRKKVATGGSRKLKKEEGDDDEDYVDDGEDDDEGEDSDSEEDEEEDEDEEEEEDDEEDEREKTRKKENKKNRNKVSSKSTSAESSKRSGNTVSASSSLSGKKRLKAGEGLQVTWTQKGMGPSNGMKAPSGSSRTSTSKSIHNATSAGDGISSTDLPLSGKTFVLTGVLDSMSREEAVGKILQLGGRCTSAVSGKTDYLVTGSILEDGREVSTGSKYRKALQLQTEGGSNKKGGKSVIQIVNESEFLTMLGKTHSNLSHVEGQQQSPSLQEEKKDNHTATSLARLSPSLSSSSSSSGGGGDEEERSFERDSGSLLWTEKYRPMHAEDLVGNREQMRNLQTWLNDWKDVCLLGKKKDPPAYRGYSSPYSSMMIAGGGGFIPPLNFNARAALLSGPPGVGKTTAARVASKMAGYHVIEFNASDVRNKLHVEEIGDMTSGGQNLHVFIERKNQKKGFMGDPKKKEGEEKDPVKQQQEGKEEVIKKMRPQYRGVCVLMDEVDGLSGGDRGGAQAIVKLIETSKCPIICICNDRMHPKVRTIASKCLDIRFQPPHISAVRQRVQSILAAENLSLSLTSIDDLCESMGGDLRQILNALQMYAYEKRDEQRTSFLLSQEVGNKDFTEKTSEERLKGEVKKETRDGGKSLSMSQQPATEFSPSWRPAPSSKVSTVPATITIGAVGLKDDQVMHGPFDSCKQLLDSSQACKLSRSRKLDRFFTDYDLMPLLIQENYLEAFRQAGVLASSPSGSSSSQTKRGGGAGYPGSQNGYYSRDSSLSSSQTKNQPVATTPSTTPSPRGGGGHLVGRKVGGATSGECNPSLLINLISGAASDLVEVDMMSTVLRGDQHWGLLPDIGFLCCVFLPSKVERVGGFVGRVQFPSWLGRNSTQTKHKRLLTELLILFLNDSRRCTNSTGLKMSGYLDAVYRKCVAPLLTSEGGQGKGAGGGKSQNGDRSSKEEMIDRALKIMDDYNVSRSMLIENLQCLRLKSETRLYDLVDTRLKTAFTRMYNASAHAKKQASAIVAATSHAKKKKMKKRNSMEGDDHEGGDDEEDDEGMLRSRTSGGEAEGDGSGGGGVQEEGDDDLDDDFIVSTAVRGGGRGKPGGKSKLVTPSPGGRGGGRVKKEPTPGRGGGGKRGGRRGGGRGGGAGSARR
ncbi:aaa family [Cystoisospora suis]|uniref:Aaa family n=1 Tax=Cystoisospora suis TaxID=483139 RepID=A0A2C6KVX8_9APIC|nr:aaa family [Cystoisospora suis]